MDATWTTRAGRWCAAAAVATTLAAAATAVLLGDPARWALVGVVVAALVWGLGSAVAVLLTPSRPAPAPGITTTDVEQVRIGVAMHLGDVPDEVARITSAIAAAEHPVALIVPPGRPVPDGFEPSVEMVQPGDAGTAGDALEVLRRRSDAVLFCSARALPGPGCSQAARLVEAGASWVTGAAAPLNRDRFGPTGRELLDAHLRRRASGAGLWCWEPDATVVRTALLARHPLRAGHPLGSWLRERAAEGLTGATVDDPLTRRAVPVAAEGYWPDTTARQRAAAADLSDAMTSADVGARPRTIAAALLVRALSGWSVLLWLAALVLLAGGSPLRHGETALVALVVCSGLLRWLSPRLACGTRPAPVADVVAGLYALPGSLAATVAAATRRVRPARWRVPTRPLVWFALVATVAAATVVLTARPGDDVARVAATLAAGLLVLLWVFTVRSLVERSWRRVGFRVPLDRPAVLDHAAQDGDGWRVVDGSPGGIGLRGPVSGLGHGDAVTVRVPRPGTDEVVLRGRVADRRGRAHGEEVLGIEVCSVAPDAGAWAQVLLDGTAAPTRDSQPTSSDGHRWGRWADRLAIGLVVAASVAVLLTLAIVLAGFRPLVIRSGSMEPTYSVGDVVLVASEPAADIRVGQVVTRFDAPQAVDSLTHRVQAVTRDGDRVHVTTQGDANSSAERWTAPAGQQVGVVVASVPAIGLPLTAVRSSTAWAVVVGAVVLAVIAVLFRPRRRRPDELGADAGFLNPPSGVPTGPGTTTIGERT
jgi:signal peptidase